MNCRSTSTFPVNGEAIALAQRHDKISTFFRSPLEIASHADYSKGKELENSDYASGRCFRQGNRFPHLYLKSVIGLVEGCPRKDRRTSCIVFSTSASPFLCPRENGSKKQSITFMQGGKA